MTDIGNFLLTGLISHVINLSRSIKVSHISPRKTPIGSFVLIRIQSCVGPAVFGTSLIAKPNIISSSEQNKCWGCFRLVHNPAVSGVCDSMLQKNSGSVWFWIFAFDSKNIQNITIFCLNLMVFKQKSVFIHNFLETFVEIRVNCQLGWDWYFQMTVLKIL